MRSSSSFDICLAVTGITPCMCYVYVRGKGQRYRALYEPRGIDTSLYRGLCQCLGTTLKLPIFLAVQCPILPRVLRVLDEGFSAACLMFITLSRCSVAVLLAQYWPT